MRPLRLFLAMAAFGLSLAPPLWGALPAPRVVDDADTVPVRGNVTPRIADAIDLGPTDSSLRLDRMILLLRPRPGASAEADGLLAEQQDPASPNYRRWLTPEEYGRRFGISEADLGAVLDWLGRNGFTVDAVAKGRGWVTFGGSVSQVQAALKTEVRDFVADGRLHRANVADPQVPRALADLVGGVVSLHDFFKLARPRTVPRSPAPGPAVNLSDGTKAMGPADFATVYNTSPLVASGIDGRGQAIAVVGRSNITIADVQYFRSFFGLPALDPVVTIDGKDPGLVKGDEDEADLDVEWAGAAAPGATVNLVVSAGTATSDGADLSAQYIVDNNLAPVLAMSFALCESDLGASGRQFYNSLWRQASAQGISVVVASGDSGSAGCDAADATSGSGLGVNGLSSTPYNVSAGGTQFADTGSSLYWNPGNTPGTLRSVKSYIPEQAWNESASVTGGSGLWATGGGPSAYVPKPSWQSAPGVPADGFRDTPDVALNSAASVPYVVFQNYDPKVGSFFATSGTSAAAPTFAGILALVAQKTGGRLGNPNPVLYRLATAQYGSGGTAVFHDVTTGNNGVPGVGGYSAGGGYDMATGLGSVDARALVNAWGSLPTSDLVLGVVPSAVSLGAGGTGGTVTASVTTTGSGSFASAVSLSVTGLPAGVTGTFAPATLTAPGSGSATLTLSATSSAAAGTWAATITASGGGLVRAAPLAVTVSSTPATPILSFTASPATVSPGGASTLGWSTSGAVSASIDNGVGPVPTNGSLVVAPAQGTRYTLTVVAPGGTYAATVTVNVSLVAYTVARLVPIVLDLAGSGGSHFSTELTLANRGTQTADVQLVYTAATALAATGGGVARTTLGPGRQLVIPDTIAWLRNQQLAIPADGSGQGGTLLVTFSGLSSTDAAFASARTTTPSASGRTGLSYAAPRLDDPNVQGGVQTGTSWLFGLRENPADRTNLALVNAGTTSPVTLAVTLFGGAGGTGTRLSPDVTLGPGQWLQVGQVLAQAGLDAGYARIDLVSGTGPYFAYAVFNDNVTNDGSFVPPESGAAAAEALRLPVLVETAVFQSDLVLVNRSASSQTATLGYRESLSPGGGSGGFATVVLAPGEQRIIPGAIAYLRLQGVPIGPAGAASYAGSLSVQFSAGGVPSAGYAGARTSAPASGGGEYGVFYPAFGVSRAASSEAWVFGVQRNAAVRSNLAVASVGDAGGVLTYHLEVYDGDTGLLAGRSPDATLAASAWVQADDLLAGYGVSNGFVRVVRTAGSDGFLAYGVVNDGATPASGATNDGSFLAFANR